jgi:hypothetical protein
MGVHESGQDHLIWKVDYLVVGVVGQQGAVRANSRHYPVNNA